MDATNRDFCLAFYELSDRPEAKERPLEDYLRALWKLSHRFRDEAILSFETVVGMFEEALTAEPPPFDEAWRESYVSDEEIERLTGYSQFQALLQNQIVDLREMNANGSLSNQWAEMGVISPRGASWSNFGVSLFMQCGAFGKFRYWSSEDAIVPLQPLTWEVLADFLLYCQVYE